MDTFSFALVLLCVALGDVRFLHKLNKKQTNYAYGEQFRPRIPKMLAQRAPVGLICLIKEMWQASLSQRPHMTEVVARLEAFEKFEVNIADEQLPGNGDEIPDDEEELSMVISVAEHEAALAAQREELRTLQDTNRIEVAKLKAALLAASG